ncbi:KR domain-containing protein [Colletotrichum navitas]|uniref:KR domain-containing protein n=1 Tax=Colletotrichum navitas TaxID=681940 RepID=A0AAD8PNH4_9PEZI|nr:KR domain-containing protein [Colletotrichum navitas]KAK1573272.1 KR domain-containing protein [Colletotrichum navitas]
MLSETRPPIAIIGLSCRFPGDATDPSKFWDMLKNGRDGYTPRTNRYNEDAFHHPGGGNKRQNVLPVKGGYLLQQDPYVWDAAFFNITAAEAIAFDPKQRIAMEVTYEALENAGLSLRQTAGTQTACYMGTSMSDYRDSIVRDFGNYPKYHLLGTSDEMISNRISHFLDIHGPSATIETACSSSHVAIHLACQSLQSDESEMAIAGGVGMTLVPESTMQLNNLGFLSPLGQSRAFDAKAGGYARGEGCGVIVLKRLDKAIADGNEIRAVIRGSGVNQDGWTRGVTMPSGDAQAALIKYVYESNGLDYGATQYVEAHGPGTQAGDPTETRAIYETIGAQGLKSNPSRKKLWIGSVKPNIGHLESAAGVAGLIKGILAMEKGFIPPNIHFDEPNPAIKFDEWGLAVPTKLTPWPACQTRRMSCSSFGMGGTNAHIVLERPGNLLLEEADAAKSGFPSPERKTRLFTFSSHDQAGFKRIGPALAEHLDRLGPAASTPEYMANLSHTLASGRSGLSWKASCFAGGAEDLKTLLVSTLGDNATRQSNNEEPRVAFVFTGQGAQWARMGIELMERRVFADSVNKSAKLLREFGASWDPLTELSKVNKISRLSGPEISQPICSVLQIALVDLLRSWGIVPRKVVGHSSGEIAAAYCIGALTHRDALAAAYFRGVASSSVQGLNGGMMAVGLSPQEVAKYISDAGVHVTIACINSPSSVTLSGSADALETLRTLLDKRGIFARRLKVDVAYHSPQMQTCSMDYLTSLGDPKCVITPESGEPVVMVSSVTASEIDPEMLNPFYWVRNLISPVRFSEALVELVTPAGEEEGEAVDILVEVGPHSALRGPIEQILTHHGIKNVAYASTLVREENAVDTCMRLAADMFRRGVSVKVAEVNGDSRVRLLTDLPPYQWNHSRVFRADSRYQREIVSQKDPAKSILGVEQPSMSDSERVWRGFIRLEEEPWLRDHTVGNMVLFPGAAVVSVVLEAAQQMFDKGKRPRSIRMRDVMFNTMMALSEDEATEIIIHIQPHLLGTAGSAQPTPWFEFTVSSATGATGSVRSNARGLLSITYEEDRGPQMMREDANTERARIDEHRRILGECPEGCPKDRFYDTLAKSALRYGDVFRGVRSCHPGNGKSAFEIEVTDIGETFTKGRLDRPFLIHGAALDAVLQAWMGTTSGANGPDSFGFDNAMLPKSIGELEISVDIPAEVGYVMPGYSRSRRHGFQEWSADIVTLDSHLSRVFLSIKDFRLAELEVDHNAGAVPDGEQVNVDPAEISFEPRWNYALDMMTRDEVRDVISKVPATTAYSRLVELILLYIHNHPAAIVVELAAAPGDLENAVVSRIPEEVINWTQIRYALSHSAEKEDKGDVQERLQEQSFPLGPLDTPLAADAPRADLIIVPHHAIEDSTQDGSGIAKRLLGLAKPNTMIFVVDSNGPDTREDPFTSALEADAFELFVSIPAGVNLLTLRAFVKGGVADAQPGGLVNGEVGKKAIILVPAKPSDAVQTFADETGHILDGLGFVTSKETGLCAEIDPSATYVSLLELEKPLLKDLSEAEFEFVRALMLDPERLLWITRGGNTFFGLIDGLARVVRSEYNSTNIQVLHLMSPEAGHGPRLASRILLSRTRDSEFMEAGGHLRVSRIYRNLEEDESVRRHLFDSTRELSLLHRSPDAPAMKLAVGKPGLLNTLQFVPDEVMESMPLGDDEVELRVMASGVNFRDIMGSLGLLPVSGIGQEASGVVVRAGKLSVANLEPGDRVTTLCVGGAHATKIRCHYRVAHKIPDNLSFEEAAGIPVPYCTAYYALVKLARLQRGQSILIHAAAGGTGQAAIQLAKHLGLIVYATVGTDEKRRLLVENYAVLDEHIFYSRDASFAKGIKRVTGGRGVDCVLNSLSGELLQESFACLATFGTFVEIGLRDITENTRLDMRHFAKSTTFTFINMVTFLQENPNALGEILDEVFGLFSKGILKPACPMTVYPIGRVEDAFHVMQQGKHMGKIVLSYSQDDGRAPVLCKAKTSLQLDPAVTYLIVGGLGGLGRSLATELVASGARNIAFISRSGDRKPDAKVTVDRLVSRGANVRVYRADVSDEAAFLAAMDRCAEDLPPVRGVIQMAMVLRDVVFAKMKYEDWTAGLQPKVRGTWNLHKYFDASRPVDFMIFCSSIAGVFGNPSQAQYAAGNTFQDALAMWRRHQGLKAVSVDLGIMRDVGVIAEGASNFMAAWEKVLGIREPVFHALMKSIINRQQSNGPSDLVPAQIVVGLGTGDIIARNGLEKPAYFDDPRFGPLAVTSSLSDVRGGADDGSNVSLASKLAVANADKDPTRASSIVKEALVDRVAEILRIPSSEVDASRPMYRYGVDSLVALEVRNWIAKEMKANMPLLEILSATPMEAFSVQIAKRSKLLEDIDF